MAIKLFNNASIARNIHENTHSIVGVCAVK